VSGITATNSDMVCLGNQLDRPDDATSLRAPAGLPWKTRQSNVWFLSIWMYLSGGLSLACAVHCALVPLMFVLAPSLKMALYSVRDPSHATAVFLLQSVRFEKPLVILGLALTVINLLSRAMRTGFRQSVWLMFGAGALLTLFGTYNTAQIPFLHAIVMMSGGVLMVLATLRSAR
jgi:hypothetical protein